MNWAKLLEWAVALVNRLVGPPPINDEEAFRDWLKKGGDALDLITDYIPGEKDDQIVDLIRVFVEDDGAWAKLYALILDFADRDEVTAAELEPKLKELRENPKVAAFPWALIVQFVIAILTAFLKRR